MELAELEACQKEKLLMKKRAQTGPREESWEERAVRRLTVANVGLACFLVAYLGLCLLLLG